MADLEGKSPITELAISLVESKAKAEIVLKKKERKQGWWLFAIALVCAFSFLIGGAFSFAINISSYSWVSPTVGSILLVLAALSFFLSYRGLFMVKEAKKDIIRAEKILNEGKENER